MLPLQFPGQDSDLFESDLFTRMLCEFCLPTSWATSVDSVEIAQNRRRTKQVERSETLKRLDVYILLTLRRAPNSPDLPDVCVSFSLS